ncbi:hypothetical protein ACFLZW_03205 [Chloroflexota bacterium]
MAVVGGGLYYFNPLNMFGKEAATATATSAPVITEEPIVSEAPPTIPTQEPTFTQAPTFTPPITSSPTTSSTEAPTDTPENTPIPGEISPQPTDILLDEQFDNQITTNWQPWGNIDDRTFIKKGFDNSASLNAENLASAGITTKKEFTFVEDFEIIFSAKLHEIFKTYQIVFNLDPAQKNRSEGDNDIGLLQLEIHKEKVVLIPSIQGEPCEKPLSGADAHTYRLVFLESNIISLFIDDSTDPICSVLGAELEVGRITFRGLGYISSIIVTTP